MQRSSPPRTPENGARKATSKSKKDRIIILVLMLIVVQVTSFLVFGFAHSNMIDQMPHFFFSKADEVTFELKDMRMTLKGMQNSIDGLRKDTESFKPMKGEMQKMKRYMEEKLTRTNNDDQALLNNPNQPMGGLHGGNAEITEVKKILNRGRLDALRKKITPVNVPRKKIKTLNHSTIIKGKNRPYPSEKVSPVIYKRTLMFLHIAKNGGTSFDRIGPKVASESQYSYVGYRKGGQRHFDWNKIEAQGQVGKDVEVVALLRHPVSRAISHFYFIKKQGYTKGSKMRDQNLTEYLSDGDKQNLLNTRDIWQDGQASVSWLTGTHIANWVGCPKDQVRVRERRALNATAMCYLAAERLQQVKWFGILEDANRGMELLQHEFNLTNMPKMGHSNTRAKKYVAKEAKPTAEEVEALESLMPQDLWLYEYAKRLFEARWQEYKTGEYTAPEYPPIPDPFPCLSTRLELNCTSGKFAGNFRGKF